VKFLITIHEWKLLISIVIGILGVYVSCQSKTVVHYLGLTVSAAGGIVSTAGS
jgi:hypothetical protein